jgi:hypothetical protein
MVLFSSIWYSKENFHIMTSHSDNILHVTTIPKCYPNMPEDEEEGADEVANGENASLSARSKGSAQSSVRDKEADNHEDEEAEEGENEEDEDDDEEEEQIPIIQTTKLVTKHKSWITAISKSFGVNLSEFGLSGDHEGKLTLWYYDEEAIDPNAPTEEDENQQWDESVDDSKSRLSGSRGSNGKHSKSTSTKNKPKNVFINYPEDYHWKIIWVNRSLSDGQGISSILIENEEPVAVKEDIVTEALPEEQPAAADEANPLKDAIKLYQMAYITTTHGKLLIIQLLPKSKSYQLLHELKVFASIGKIDCFTSHSIYFPPSFTPPVDKSHRHQDKKKDDNYYLTFMKNRNKRLRLRLNVLLDLRSSPTERLTYYYPVGRLPVSPP